MRLCIVFLIFCINFYVNAEVSPLVCYDKFGIKPMEFYEQIGFDKPDDKTKCTLICFAKLKGLVDEKGRLNVPVTIAEVANGLLNKNVAEKIVNSCNKVREEENDCAKGFSVVRCIQLEVDRYQMTKQKIENETEN